MSSLIVIQQKNAVHLITDAAHYDERGIVCALRSKVVELPNSGCAFAVRGASWPSIPLSFLLSKFASLDEILEAMPGLLSSCLSVFDALTSDQATPVRRHFEVTVAGWSDQMKSMIAGIATTFNANDPDDPQGLSYVAGYRPRVPFWAAAMAMMPPVDISAVLGRPIESLKDVETVAPATDGLALFESQRCFPAMFEGEPRYLVGGFAELTTIRRDGITRQILKQWREDEIGHTLQPNGAPTVEELSAMFKKQGIEQVRLLA